MAKKNFIDKENPALQFLSSSADQDPPEIPTEVPEGYKLNPLYLEVKSRRIQLVLRPSLFERAKTRADADGISFNEYVHRALEDATRKDL